MCVYARFGTKDHAIERNGSRPAVGILLRIEELCQTSAALQVRAMHGL